MKNKKGFTLIELLAVIVVLSIILIIAVPSVLNAIESSKEKTKYTAAKEIVEIASVYMTENNLNCVDVETLVGEGYLEEDMTDPETGKNRTAEVTASISAISPGISCVEDFDKKRNRYCFDDHYYYIKGENCK